MAEPLVSVVIPVYNTEEYLSRCVDSVLRQTVPDWELILVDDGSTDGSGALCDAYAKKDARIRVIHQPNGGVSAARNAGMDAAAGEFLHFVDSDDEIVPEMLEELLPLMEDGEVGLAVGGFRWLYPGRGADSLIPRRRFRPDETDCLVSAYISVCGKLFRAGLIRERRLRFTTRYAAAEDLIFMLEYLGCVSWAAAVPKVLYWIHLDDPGRPHAVTSILADLFEVWPAEIAVRLYRLSGRDETLQVIYDKVVLNVIRAYAGREFFPRGELWPRVRAVLRQPLVRRAAKVYRRTRAGDSLIIPFLLRLRCPLAALFLRERGKRYVRERGGKLRVKSVYRENFVQGGSRHG